MALSDDFRTAAVIGANLSAQGDRTSQTGLDLLASQVHESHLTRDGDRWDLLSWDYQGDPFGYENIVYTNFESGDRLDFAAGQTLKIVRDLEETSEQTINTSLKQQYPIGLPPWKT